MNLTPILNLTPTIGLEEVAWIAVALVGLVYVRRNRKEAHEDLVAVRVTGKNGIRKLAAEHAVWAETTIQRIDGVFLAVGVIALTRPPTSQALLNRIFLAGLLILASVLLTRLSIRGAHVRRKQADALDSALEAESLRTAKALMAEDIEAMKYEEGKAT